MLRIKNNLSLIIIAIFMSLIIFQSHSILNLRNDFLFEDDLVNFLASNSNLELLRLKYQAEESHPFLGLFFQGIACNIFNYQQIALIKYAFLSLNIYLLLKISILISKSIYPGILAGILFILDYNIVSILLIHTRFLYIFFVPSTLLSILFLLKYLIKKQSNFLLLSLLFAYLTVLLIASGLIFFGLLVLMILYLSFRHKFILGDLTRFIQKIKGYPKLKKSIYFSFLTFVLWSLIIVFLNETILSPGSFDQRHSSFLVLINISVILLLLLFSLFFNFKSLSWYKNNYKGIFYLILIINLLFYSIFLVFATFPIRVLVHLIPLIYLGYFSSYSRIASTFKKFIFLMLTILLVSWLAYYGYQDVITDKNSAAAVYEIESIINNNKFHNMHNLVFSQHFLSYQTIGGLDDDKKQGSDYHIYKNNNIYFFYGRNPDMIDKVFNILEKENNTKFGILVSNEQFERSFTDFINSNPNVICQLEKEFNYFLLKNCSIKE